MATPDLSNVPTEDLQHIAAGDMTKVSEPVLRYLSGQPQKIPTMGGGIDTTGAIEKGFEDVGKNALETIPALMTHAAAGVTDPAARLVARGLAAVQGKDTNAAADAASTWLNRGVTNPTTPVRDPLGNAVAGAVKPVVGAVTNAAGTVANTVENAAEGAIPGAKNAIEEASGVGNDIVGSIPALGAAHEAMTAGRAAAGDLAGQLGFRSAEDHPVGTTLAGKSAGPTLGAHNSDVGTSVINAEAGVPNGVTPSYSALEQARAPAEAVMGRTAASIPTGGLSNNAVRMVEEATNPTGRITTGSPEVANRIAALREQLLGAGDRTGQEWLVENRALRQEGFADLASGDTDRAIIGKARLGSANAIEQHIEDSIPPGANVDLDQFQDARKMLAKNSTAQAILHKGGVGDAYDLNTLARMHQDNPDLFDGNMRTAAEFASSHPDVVTPPSELEGTPGIGSDIGNISLHRPASYIRPLTGALGRRLLTGGGGTLDATNAFFRANPPNRFAPITPGQVPMEAAPGQVGERPPPPQLSLGDLLQGPGPRPGLDLAPPPGSAGAPPMQGSLGDLVQGPGNPEQLALTAPPGTVAEPAQRTMPLPQGRGPINPPARREGGETARPGKNKKSLGELLGGG